MHQTAKKKLVLRKITLRDLANVRGAADGNTVGNCNTAAVCFPSTIATGNGCGTVTCMLCSNSTGGSVASNGCGDNSISPV